MLFGPGRTFGRERLDLGLAEILSEGDHEPLVAPGLGGSAIHSTDRELPTDEAEQLSRRGRRSAPHADQRQMLKGYYGEH